MEKALAVAFLLDRLGLRGAYWPVAEAKARARSLGMIQIDSIRVNGLRNHELAWAARTDAPLTDFYALLYGERGMLETHYPLFATRRDWLPFFMKDFHKAISDPSRLAEMRPLMRRVKRHIAAHGPVSPADFESERIAGGFNTIKATTKALEYLFLSGEVQIAGRTPHFHRLFDLTERVAPDLLMPPKDWRGRHKGFFVESALDVLKLATPAQLAERVAHHLARWRGGGLPTARRLIETALDEAVIARVEIDLGTARHAYLARRDDLDAFLKRNAAADDKVRIVPPLDNLLFSRRRLLDLLGLAYKFEAYTPKRARRFYFAMPILHRDRIIGLIDAKKDGATWRIEGLELNGPAPWQPLRAAVHRLAAIAACDRVRTGRRVSDAARRALAGDVRPEGEG